MGDPKDQIKIVLRAFSIELPVYAILVLAYGFIVLHFLAHPLFQLFTTDRKLYAAVALVLIIAQGYFLEILARGLLALIKRKRDK
jgi:membrane protease YdiL (CAAX protease family)